MAGVYRLPAAGGAASARFKAYVALGADGVPVSGYNPMTNKPVLATIESLLAASAEPTAEVLANRTVDRLGVTSDAIMHLCVKTPGMWTDRVASEVEHRMVRGPVEEILWWTGERTDEGALGHEVVAQTTRMAWDQHRGHPVTVAEFVAREGLAMAMAGVSGRRVPAVAQDELDTDGVDLTRSDAWPCRRPVAGGGHAACRAARARSTSAAVL